jgi:hypothetical protein
MVGMLSFIAGGALQGLGQGISNEAKRRWDETLKRAEDLREERMAKAKAEYDVGRDEAREAGRRATNLEIEGKKAETALRIAGMPSRSRPGEGGGDGAGMTTAETRYEKMATERSTKKVPAPGYKGEMGETVETFDANMYADILEKSNSQTLKDLAALARQTGSGGTSAPAAPGGALGKSRERPYPAPRTQADFDRVPIGDWVINHATGKAQQRRQ